MVVGSRVTVVCRDCGEVGHYDLAGLKPNGLVSCTACGLVLNVPAMRAPAWTPAGGFRSTAPRRPGPQGRAR